MLSMMLGISGVGDLAGGDVIITSKRTESLLVPFMARMGVNTANCEDAMENYWNSIGGRCISDTEIQRYQASLAAALRPRLGTRSMNMIGPGRQRQSVALPVQRRGRRF